MSFLSWLFKSSNSDQITGLGTQANSIQSTLSNYADVSSAALNTSGVSLDYSALVTAIAASSSFAANAANSIMSNGSFASGLVTAISSSGSTLSGISGSIASNNNFAGTVAGILTSNPTYISALKGATGAPGNVGNYSSLRANFTSVLPGAKAPITIWCGDSGGCTIPSGISSLTPGGTSLLLAPSSVVFNGPVTAQTISAGNFANNGDIYTRAYGSINAGDSGTLSTATLKAGANLNSPSVCFGGGQVCLGYQTSNNYLVVSNSSGSRTF